MPFPNRTNQWSGNKIKDCIAGHVGWKKCDWGAREKKKKKRIHCWIYLHIGRGLIVWYTREAELSEASGSPNIIARTDN